MNVHTFSLPVLGQGREGEEARHVLAPHPIEAVVPVEAFVEILGKVVDRLPVEFPTGEHEEVRQDGEGPEYVLIKIQGGWHQAIYVRPSPSDCQNSFSSNCFGENTTFFT